jgi:5-formyltetrahydrofolate cyclo-ligase
MSPVSAVPPIPAIPAVARSRRDASSAPLYRQVCDQLELLAMNIPLGDDAPLPPETQLMTRFGVSRGTLRRAVEELVREGLLAIEPGRGTFVVQSTKVRWTVWDRLHEVAVADSRFDRDLSRFVPDFDGREECDRELWALSAYSAASTVFFAPDNSLEIARRQALAEGKRIIVPTFGMRRGFVLLDGSAIEQGQHAFAATLDGMERVGLRLDLAALRAIGSVDLVVTGAVAVTRRGLHFGGGDGYFDLEWALLRHCGLVTSRTLVAVIAHDCQVLDADIRPGRHDAVADIVITPTTVLHCAPSLPKPEGIIWEEIRTMWNDDISYVRELRDELAPSDAASTSLPRRWREPSR